MFRKVLGYGFVGVSFIGTAVTLHRNEYEIDALAVVRVTRAAATAFNIGYCYKTLLYSKGLDKRTKEYLELRSKVHKIGAEKLLNLCLTNKGVYIKVGQHIGALEYLLPLEYVETMKVLHKDVPPDTVEQLYKVIKEELKRDPKDLFVEFESAPLGTASLAQVHRAKLSDGTSVAVKVQHRFVRDNTRADIRSMEFLVKIMSWAFPEFDMQWLVDETKRNIFRELDFAEEGRNAEKVAEMFKGYTWLKVPKVYWEYTTPRVLVMEYVNGGQVNDLKYVKEHKIDPYDLSRKLGDLYSHMIFVKGYVHSDPHPGNILLKKDLQDKDVTVYLLDHGLYATLTDEFRYHYSQFWLSVINRDHERMKLHALHLGIQEEMYGALACMVTGRTWSAIQQGIGKVQPGDEERDLVREKLPEVLDTIAVCLRKIDRQALLILKTNDLIRSIEYSLRTSDRMCGFTVMTKCCLLSVYSQKARDAESMFAKFKVGAVRMWIVFKFYVIMTCIHFKSSIDRRLAQYF